MPCDRLEWPPHGRRCPMARPWSSGERGGVRVVVAAPTVPNSPTTPADGRGRPPPAVMAGHRAVDDVEPEMPRTVLLDPALAGDPVDITVQQTPTMLGATALALPR